MLVVLIVDVLYAVRGVPLLCWLALQLKAVITHACFCSVVLATGH
jgi:hypothetical protein